MNVKTPVVSLKSPTTRFYHYKRRREKDKRGTGDVSDGSSLPEF